MRVPNQITGLAALLVAGVVVASAPPGAVRGADAPPRAAPPPVTDRVVDPVAIQHGLGIATTEYSHGDPTDDEQWFLELMNRARANPPAEADRMLVDYDSKRVKRAVDFFLNQRPGIEFTRQENHDAVEQLPVAPPLAMNRLLLQAARSHSVIMQAADDQVHQVTGEPTLGQRITALGYPRARLAESIFISADDMLHAHAGFAVDWGQSDLDPQSGRPILGHRDFLMDTEFVETGVGLFTDDDPNTDAGPILITIDFAAPEAFPSRFVTGVVYVDQDENGMYDPGEGIPGVRIETDVSDFYAISSSSGGYSVPVELPVSGDLGSVTVMASGAPGTSGEIVGEQQTVVQVGRDNVKVDFGPPVDPPLPAVETEPGATGVAIADGAITETTLAVVDPGPGFDSVGDLDVTVELNHGAREELTISLIGPTGATAVLFDGSVPGVNVHGTFDTTLRPSESLSAFVGTQSGGVWTLRIEDAAGGVTDGVLASWALHLRRAWVRDIFSEPSPLVVKALTVKNSPKAGKDKLILKADLDAGGIPLDGSLGGLLRLVDAEDGSPYVEVDLAAPGAKRATPAGAKVKSKIKLDASTSRGSVTVKVSGLDVDGFAPSTTRVELAIGGALLTQDVAMAAGKSTGYTDPLFFVDKVVSKPGKKGGRTTLVKGRFDAGRTLSTLDGIVEIGVGTALVKIDTADMSFRGSKWTFKEKPGVRKLVIDLAKGKFALKYDGDHEALVDGVVPVSMRLGTAFFGATSVQPTSKGTKTQY